MADRDGKAQGWFNSWKGAAVVIGVVIVLGAMVGGGDRPADQVAGETAGASEPAQPAEPAAPVNDPAMSAAEFAALEPGMTYADAVAIIGSPGELISENALAGTTTQMFQWEGEGGLGANANAMFQNGALVQKSQFGLE